jgi:hypothetical protein
MYLTSHLCLLTSEGREVKAKCSINCPLGHHETVIATYVVCIGNSYIRSMHPKYMYMHMLV